MVDIHVDIEHSCVVFQQLEDAEDDVVCVAESTGLALLCMVHPSSPVDCYSSISPDQSLSCVDGPSAGQLAELEQPRKARAISSLVHGELALQLIGVDIEASLLLTLEHHVIDDIEASTGEDIFTDVVLKVTKVLVVMEFEHLISTGLP